MPRMVWPTWLSRLPAETTRAKAGSLLSSWSCCFHLEGGGDELSPSGSQASEKRRPIQVCAHFLSSDTSMLVPNLMCFRGPLLLRATLKTHTHTQYLQ